MRSWKFSKSLSSVMFLRKGISVLIPGFDSSPLRDANSTVSRLKWGARTPLTHRPLCCLSHSRISVVRPSYIPTYTHTFLLILEVMWLYRMLKQSAAKQKRRQKKTKLNYFQQINIYIALQYCLMDGKAFAWKSVTDSEIWFFKVTWQNTLK